MPLIISFEMELESLFGPVDPRAVHLLADLKLYVEWSVMVNTNIHQYIFEMEHPSVKPLIINFEMELKLLFGPVDPRFVLLLCNIGSLFGLDNPTRCKFIL